MPWFDWHCVDQCVSFADICLSLGYHLKTSHTLSVQNRPTGLAEDVIVLPFRSVVLQG